MLMCFNKTPYSLPHCAPQSVSHRCLHTYLQLGLNMCSPETFFQRDDQKHIHTYINIYNSQSHIHGRLSDVFIDRHPHVHTSGLLAQKHISQLISSLRAGLSYGVTCQTFTVRRRNAPLSRFYCRMWAQGLVYGYTERRSSASEGEKQKEGGEEKKRNHEGPLARNCLVVEGCRRHRVGESARFFWSCRF